MGDYTWAFWAKANGTQQTYSAFFCKSSNTARTVWMLYAGGLAAGPTYPATSILVEHGNGAGTAGETWHTGILLADIADAWHHIAVTRSGTTMTAYLDGVQKATGTMNFALVGGNQTFNIAYPRTHSGNFDRYYKGAMDDLGIWDNALDAAAIAELYMQGVVSPADKTTVMAGYGSGDPSPMTYTVTNYDKQRGYHYAVAEVDASGKPQDHTWLSLPETNLAIAAGGSDTLEAVISSSSLPIGTYQAYLKFTDDATPPRQTILQIELQVLACGWEVTPSTDINAILNPAASVKNVGMNGLTYTVGETCSWLDLNYSGGPLAYNQTDTVTGTINDAGLDDGFHTCQLVFTNSCTPAQQETRTVTYAKALSVDLGTTDVEKGIIRVAASDGETTPVNQGGRDCRMNLDPVAVPEDFYFYFQVDDQYAFNGNNPVQHITIEYYDTGSDSLQLQYDATGYAYQDGGSVTLTGSNTWKQHTFVVADAWFGNRQNGGSDFRISKQGPAEYFYLNVVRVQGKAACESLVSPIGQVTASAIRNYPATPPSVVYTLENIGVQGGLNYTVRETDATGGTPTDYAWLSLSKASGGPLASLATDPVPVTASIEDTSMAPGTYTGYISFDDSCSHRHVRRIDLTIIGCQWQVSPSAATVHYAPEPGSTVASPVFTITNTAADGLSYTTAKDGTCSWLSLDKTGGGPLAYNQTDTVTATIDPAGLAVGTYTCDVQFTYNANPTNNCAADVQTRTVTLIILPSVTAGAIAHYRMDETDPITEIVDSIGGYDAAVDKGGPTSITPAPAPSAYGGISFNGSAPDSAMAPASATALQLTGDYTWALWAKADSEQQTYACFFTKADVTGNPQSHWQLYAGGSGTAGDILVSHMTDAWVTGIKLADIAGAWHHIAVTRTGTTMSAYLDGVLKATGECLTAPGTGNETFNIAFARKHATTFDRYYSGAMDDLLFYDRALGQNAIQKLMLYGATGKMWADADEDGDVDQTDFAVFQTCITADGVTIPTECVQFDHNLDNVVDDLDFTAFEDCATGPGIPLDPVHLPSGCTF